MAVRDVPSLLLLGLLALLHTWGASAKVEVNMVEKVEVYLGETAEINCSFTSDDGISGSGGLLIKWFHETSSGKRQKIYHQESLQNNEEKNTPFTGRIKVNSTSQDVVMIISNVQLSDEGEFICEVRSVTEGSKNGSTKLRVFKKPDQPTIEGVENGISINDPISKIGTCEVKNGYPKPNVTWYRENTPLRNIPDGVQIAQEVTSESSGLFSIKSYLSIKVKKEDKDAHFYCEVQYNIPGAEKMYESQRIQPTVYYPSTAATISVKSPNGHIKEGDTVELHCITDGNSESEEIQIIHKGVKLTDDATAVLERVTRLQDGVYECKIMNMYTFEEISANIDLRVNYLDEAVIEPKGPLEVVQKNELNTSCNALSSLHTETTWLKDGKEVSRGHFLNLANVTYEDAGTYVCVVTVPSVKGMQTNSSLQVHIQGPPQNSIPTENDINYKDEDVELSCYARGYPSPNITWTTSDDKVLGSATYTETNDGAKSVVKVKASDMTIFCKSQNGYGTHSVEYNIKAVINKHTTTPATTTADYTTTTADNTTINVTTNTSTTTNAAISKSTVKPETAKPPEKVKKGNNGVIIAVIIICILLLAILGSVLYFLYKKGKICNRSGKQDFTKEKSGKDKIVVEMKSDKSEEAILLGVNGEKQLPSDQ
ncbi:PREDICTED: cell surface glycoprotein MUC18 isoform X1 [Cyprinodon variegatus]|uniref:Melanoma cell adhesion molecule b n=1 Tax=Cyprinodon variegatus TaxID=28743 RepID=A0A3Q2DVN6_CYPVA|nr:PREDICTED: cell surface glycoprotein MUC18 isoform X1 [Cyprinodon variegatus]